MANKDTMQRQNKNRTKIRQTQDRTNTAPIPSAEITLPVLHNDERHSR